MLDALLGLGPQAGEELACLCLKGRGFLAPFAEITLGFL